MSARHLMVVAAGTGGMQFAGIVSTIPVSILFGLLPIVSLLIS